MNYELVKQLKDAGFPIKFSDIHVSSLEKPSGAMWQEPTLSELIEACGKGFIALEYNQDVNEKWKWEAEAWKEDNLISTGPFSTPEEAVANLWLELNKAPEGYVHKTFEVKIDE